MQTPQAASNYYKQQQQISVATAASVQKLWARMDDEFDASWQRVAPAVLSTVQLGRAAAVTTSIAYTPAVLAETNQRAPAAGALVASRFLESAPNGLPMEDMLGGAVTHAKSAVKGGASSGLALRQAGGWLTGLVLTTMADTGRSVVGADIVSRPAITGYVRMLNAPSCKNCVILAGKWFRWNAGFERHPRCDCRHIPAAENMAGDLRTDPYEYFKSLTTAEQDKAWGRIEARAIRDGADIYRVTNVGNRGLSTAKNAARYGTPSRMTIDDIYRTAGHRTNAIRMMEREGYILPAGQVPGGSIVGRYRESFAAPIGRPIVAGSNRARVLDARATGVRDPLDRATMTSAERRLYDASYRLNYARSTGTVPPSVLNPRGLRPSDADVYVLPRAVTPAELRAMEEALQIEVAKLSNATDSVRRLAGLLGL